MSVKTVLDLPRLVRDTDNWEDYRHLQRMALLCLMGEQINMSWLQVYWLNRIHHDRPDCLSYADWFEQLHNKSNGIKRLLTKRMFQRDLAVNTWPTSEKYRKYVSNELRVIGQALIDFTPQILKLLRLPVEKLSWDPLVEHHHLMPATASYFMLVTRPCENVVLSPYMLRWASRVPPVTPVRDKVRPTPYPEIAPIDLFKYQRIERMVRRQQRMVFPQMTALEAHTMIHMEGSQDEMVDPRRRVWRDPVQFDGGSGI